MSQHTHKHATKCDGKAVIGTKVEAIGIAKRARRETGARTLTAYKCRHCGRWHIGHG